MLSRAVHDVEMVRSSRAEGSFTQPAAPKDVWETGPWKLNGVCKRPVWLFSRGKRAYTNCCGGIARAGAVATPVPLLTLVPLLSRHGHDHDHDRAVATEAGKTRLGRLEPFA